MSERFDREASLAIKAALSCARRQGALEMGGEHLVVGIGLSTARLRRGNCCWLSTSIRWHCAEQCCGHWQTAGSVQDLP